ncbi:hypothetical protein HC024_12295 [Methylococcaceae bacterium WWC4]|nr:hypothetical protein [Methylococcaceae bacterium WWC4]
MLKPIIQPLCCGALHACRNLQVKLTEWLCDPANGATDITEVNLTPPRVPSQIEANWLWDFLQKIDAGKTLLERAQTLADMPMTDKQQLSNWTILVSNVASQFQQLPTPIWPVTRPAIPDTAWEAFKELMLAFYKKAFRSGLPYLADGTPVATGGVNYTQFLKAFRNAHRLKPDPGAREVCVVCGGPLGQTPEVDHWIAESAYPLLSVCANNLLPSCGDCNSTSNKGTKSVHSGGTFTDWFHPYFRHPNDRIRLDYDLQTHSITATATSPRDTVKVANLDKLFNLSNRWTREFKAEYSKQQEILLKRERRRINNGQARHSQAEVLSHLQTVKEDLLATEPHYEVHNVLCAAMLEQSRLAAWQTELGLVS